MSDHLPVDPALVTRMAAVSSPAVTLRALPLRLLLSVRARGGACARVAAVLGVEALPRHGPMLVSPVGRVTWLRPDEWLVEAALAADALAADALAADALAADARATDALVIALSEAVGDGTPNADGAVVVLSASRHTLELSGARARDVLAAVCTLDLHPRTFPVGHATQTLLSRAPVLLQLVDATPTWRLLVRPSFVSYVVEWLADAMEGA
jgi:sarcosine oxidase subunit gamma